MSFVTRGFHGRRRDDDGRLPPGQHLTGDFPVLSAGPTPRIPLDEWELWVATEDGTRHALVVDRPHGARRRRAAPSTSTASRAGPSSTRRGAGVSLDTLLADVETAADYALVHSYGGYTTNLPLEDLLDGKAWVAYEFDGDELAPRARRARAAARAAPLLLEVGEVGARHRADARGHARASGSSSATTTTETHGASSGTRGTERPARLAGGTARRAPRRDRRARRRSCST